MAGTAEMIITPPPGTPLLGPIQRSNGVHDDLYARALVLNDRQQRIAILCLDLVGMAFALADEIRNAIRERTGITVTLVNCSHNHSRPSRSHGPCLVLGGFQGQARVGVTGWRRNWLSLSSRLKPKVKPRCCVPDERLCRLGLTGGSQLARDRDEAQPEWTGRTVGGCTAS